MKHLYIWSLGGIKMYNKTVCIQNICIYIWGMLAGVAELALFASGCGVFTWKSVSVVMCAMPHTKRSQVWILAKTCCLFREAGWAGKAHPVVSKVNAMKLSVPGIRHVHEDHYYSAWAVFTPTFTIFTLSSHLIYTNQIRWICWTLSKQINNNLSKIKHPFGLREHLRWWIWQVLLFQRDLRV